MKKLIIVRHSKANKQPEREDKQRSLAGEGVKRAKKIAQLVHRKLAFTPEYWLSSYANRALHTSMIFAEEFDCIGKVKVSKELYTFSATDLLQEINKIPDVISSAIVFGHNTAVIDLINHLTGSDLKEFKPGSVAYIQLHQYRWGGIATGDLKLLVTKEDL